jgi:hypothetical protein
MKASIDRFEGEWAILDLGGKQQKRARKELDPKAREGDVIDLVTGKVDQAATQKLVEEVKAARAKAEGNNPHGGGSFDL